MNYSVLHFIAFGYNSFRFFLLCKPQRLFLNIFIRSALFRGFFNTINEEEKLTTTYKYFHLFNLQQCRFGQTDLT